MQLKSYRNCLVPKLEDVNKESTLMALYLSLALIHQHIPELRVNLPEEE